jgi:hypothetical protein
MESSRQCAPGVLDASSLSSSSFFPRRPDSGFDMAVVTFAALVIEQDAEPAYLEVCVAGETGEGTRQIRIWMIEPSCNSCLSSKISSLSACGEF